MQEKKKFLVSPFKNKLILSIFYKLDFRSTNNCNYNKKYYKYYKLSNKIIYIDLELI